ncbi:MAG: TVP38/TMEM64 family protein [Candidatus Brennerbacteria bacterium]|nr:TVP38/TMEM64 family protein [Candidatus Brennerbacteria bacterium]
MSHKQKLLWLAAGAVLAVLFLVPVFFPGYNRYAAEIIEQYPALAPVVIIVFRFLGIVLAPLPGGPVAFASIALLPWPAAWLYNLIGVELGSVCAFFIARKWREPVAAKFAPLQELHAWQEKISKQRQFWGFVALRSAAAVVVDFLSYAAGLSKIPFRTFVLASVSVDALVSIPFFYLGSVAVSYGVYFTAAFVALFALFFFLAKYRRSRP